MNFVFINSNRTIGKGNIWRAINSVAPPLGKREAARAHWMKYLELEPVGYYSRKAKQEIQSLQ